ncbi:MAG: M16 family metallopeptidase, partial [Pirellulales bacterium]
MKQTLHSATLENGIVLLGEELPDLESVAVAFHVPAGGIHDGPGRCGLASLTSEMMLRGAGNRDSRTLVEDLALAGINWSNAVSTTHATYFGAMVARRLPEALPIYADILRRPMRPEDQFESGRQVVLQGLAGTDDDPSHRTLLALKKLVFPAPWGLPSEGLIPDVEQLTPAAVAEFAARHVRPDEMIVAAAGRLDWPDFVKRMEDLFGDWQPGSAPTVANGPRGG